jgi:hypothetical protein
MKLEQRLEGSKYKYRVFLNKNKILEKENTRALNFYNVKMYVGDPWYPAQPGYIRNLKITNLNSEYRFCNFLMNIFSKKGKSTLSCIFIKSEIKA